MTKQSPILKAVSYWEHAHKNRDKTADYLLLATVDAKKRPHVRSVLIKTFDEKGIGFVTNKTGPKVQQFKKNKMVEGCIIWPTLCMQVRIAGTLRPMAKKQIDFFWSKRDRQAQILYSLGLPQSSEIPSYAYLLEEVRKLGEKWKDKKVIPTAPNYVGFILAPKTIEFLHHNISRLNQREFFTKTKQGWKLSFLAP
ncbi:MAG: pyridoxamine 5'-phosphate oxidase family protein [Deltaproteobacteria bacterium]|nr:pyridoxamine 5'-phosphate oxidase family protein [Deltaproteobacteria bacterium]